MTLPPPSMERGTGASDKSDRAGGLRPEPEVSALAGAHPSRGGCWPKMEGIDAQVLVAASELDSDQKTNPEWLWYTEAHMRVSLGRWHRELKQAPYIRADIALAAAASAIEAPAGDETQRGSVHESAVGREPETPILAAARSDAEFDGRPWHSLGRVDRERYIARATKAHASAERAAYERAAKVADDYAKESWGFTEEESAAEHISRAILSLIDKPKEPT